MANRWGRFGVPLLGIANPPEQNDALLDVEEVEAGITLRQALKLVLAMAAGDITATAVKAAGDNATTRITYSSTSTTRTVTDLNSE